MADYSEALKDDLVEQFKGQPRIEALMDVIGSQLQDVYDFFEQLSEDRGVYTAVELNLDGVGNIVDMTRQEAGRLARVVHSDDPLLPLEDEEYRPYLIYKILRNTGECTYPNIVKVFKMFWDEPLYYTESADVPATMIFDTGELDGEMDVTPLVKVPVLRAGGVTLKLYVRRLIETDPEPLYAGGHSDMMLTVNMSQIDEEAMAEAAILAAETEIAAVFTLRLGNLAFSINSDDGGLDITVLEE